MQPKDVFLQSSLFEPSRRSQAQPHGHAATGPPGSSPPAGADATASRISGNGATASAATAAADQAASAHTLQARDVAAAAAAPANGPFSGYRQQAMQAGPSREPEVRLKQS